MMNIHTLVAVGIHDNSLSVPIASILTSSADRTVDATNEPEPLTLLPSMSSPGEEEFNAAIGVCQLIALLMDAPVAFSATAISAWHNLTFAEDNQTWTDNGTGQTGTAYDLMETVYGHSCATEIQNLMNRIRDLDESEARALSPDGEWGALPDVEFPLERLPAKLRHMAEAIKAMEGVPSVMAASAVIGATSASLGSGIAIQSKNDKTACGNLFFLLDAPSGAGKSGTSERAVRPVREFEKDLILKRSQRIQQLTAELAAKERACSAQPMGVSGDEAASEIEHIRVQLEESKQPCNVLVADTTTEKLASICAGNGGAVASFSGEARGIVQVLAGRYDKGSPNDSFYLSAFSGEPFRQERLGRASCLVERPCLSVMWMVQPDVYNKMWTTESFFEGGLLPRFLCCRTNAEIQECSDERKVFPGDVQETYHQLLTELLETYRSREGEAVEAVVSGPARKIIIGYANQIVRRRKAKEFSDKAECFASRWAELTWKMALVFHAAEHGRNAHLEEVHAETAMSALAVVSWFACQQVNQLLQFEQSELEAAEPKIMELASKVGRITARSVAKAGIVRTSVIARSLLAELEEQGLLVSALSHGKGRPTRHYSRPSGKIDGK